MVEKKQDIEGFIIDLQNESATTRKKYEGTISAFLKQLGRAGKNFDTVWKNSTEKDKQLVFEIYDHYRDFREFQKELISTTKQLKEGEITEQSLQQRYLLSEDGSEKEETKKQKSVAKSSDKGKTQSEYERQISELIKQKTKSHPKTMEKMGQIVGSFTDTFQAVPDGIFIDPQWFKINKRREKIYDRVKLLEKQQMLTASENNKLLYKQVTRNGGQGGADLAVVENQHGIEEYRVKYPSLDQMLNLKVVEQYAFDIAQKKHLTFVQTNLLTDILKSGGSIVMPNLEFLRQEYVQKQQLGQDYSEEFKKYQEAVTKQVGSQVSYIGEQNWQPDIAKPTKNLAAPALQTPLQKPNMIAVKDVLLGIDHMADYISKLSGNLNHLQLNKYKQVDDVFSSSVVQKKEPTTFKPQAGMAFKLRELMC